MSRNSCSRIGPVSEMLLGKVIPVYKTEKQNLIVAIYFSLYK